MARRLARLVRSLPAIITDKNASAREKEMTDALFRDFYVTTVSTGHDHAFRAEPRLVTDAERKTTTRATVLDTSTWTDQLPEIRRDSGFIPDQQRGVLVVDFDAKGSHPALMNYDPIRGLQKAMILETEKEAAESGITIK